MSLAAVIGSLPPFLSFLQSTEKKVGSGKKGKLTFNVHFFKLREKPCRYHDHHDLNDLKAVYFCMPDRKFWKTCMTHLPNGFTIHNRCKNMNENTFLASIWLGQIIMKMRLSYISKAKLQSHLSSNLRGCQIQ